MSCKKAFSALFIRQDMSNKDKAKNISHRESCYGFPNIKAMLKMENQGLKKIWFSTNTSSKRVEQIKKNPKACVYFVDSNEFKGLMLVGNIKILQSSRQRLWQEGFERYYPLGVDDPDYSVLCFTGMWGNFYHGLSNIDFEI
jgi:general stress protein 26